MSRFVCPRCFECRPGHGPLHTRWGQICQECAQSLLNSGAGMVPQAAPQTKLVAHPGRVAVSSEFSLAHGVLVNRAFQERMQAKALGLRVAGE